MNLELTIAILALVLGGSAFAYSLLRPNINGERIDKLLKQLDDQEKQVDELRAKYQTVIIETMRLTSENIWLRTILTKFDIPIPPLPDYLKPHFDERGNITIVVNRDTWGGATVTGGKMDVGNDFIAGDKKKD